MPCFLAQDFLLSRRPMATETVPQHGKRANWWQGGGKLEATLAGRKPDGWWPGHEAGELFVDAEGFLLVETRGGAK